MIEQLYLHFQESDDIIALTKMIAGRKEYLDRDVDFDLSEYFSGNLRRISRKHFAIHQENGQFFIEDLGSTNGTEVDGQALVKNQWKKIRNKSKIILAPRKRPFAIEVIDEERKKEIEDSITLFDDDVTELAISEDRQYFYLNGKEIELSDIQRALMQYLYKNIGTTCSHYEITTNVWKGGVVQPNSITQTISKIRKQLDKIEQGAGKNHIKTITGQGYRLMRKYPE